MRGSLGEALKAAGFNEASLQLRTVALNFIKSSGTREQWIALFDAAAEGMPGDGHARVASDGLLRTAKPRQPVEDGAAKNAMRYGLSSIAPSSSSNHDERGQAKSAREGQSWDAPSRRVADRGGEGQTGRAENGLVRISLPVREPKPQRPPIDFGAASVAIKTKLAQSVLDRVKTSDGRAWGDVGAHELDGMSRDGVLAQAIKSHIGVLSNSQRFKTIRELVNAETFETIRRQVHGA